MAAQRYHIIIDLTQVPTSRLSDEDGLNNFLNTLPRLIGMKVLKPPVVINGIPENPGLTGFVIIDFSHISIHTFTNHNQALIDIFSCKSYVQEEAVKAVLEHFQADRQNAKIQQVSWG